MVAQGFLKSKDFWMYFKSWSFTIVTMKIAKDAEINDLIHNNCFGNQLGCGFIVVCLFQCEIIFYTNKIGLLIFFIKE